MAGIAIEARRIAAASAFPHPLVKAPKRDGSHGFLCPVLAIPTQPKKGDAMKKIIWALAFAITTGMALTTAFGFNLLPLHLI
jgi:hypothetical protein